VQVFILIGASVNECQFSVGAGLQWVRVLVRVSRCESLVGASSVGASLHGCESLVSASSVGASLRVFCEYESLVGASLP
jgi:hypothetical protein